MIGRPAAVAAVALLVLSACAVGPDSGSARSASGGKVLREWADAFASGDGVTGCSLSTRQFQSTLVERAVAEGLVQPGASCADAFAATSEARASEGWSLVVEKVTAIEEHGNRASFEVQWTDSEDGDGAGFTLVLRGGRWLVAK
jgi:hypothetical protein